MAIKNKQIGGKDWTDGEGVKNQDLNDTFDAVTYRQIAIDDSVTTLSVDVDTYDNNTPANDSDEATKTVSIPAGSVNKYIEIKSFVFGRGSAYKFEYGSASVIADIKMYKTYDGTDTDLLPNFEFYRASDSGNTGSVKVVDSNAATLYYYYEPTEDEKTNGFDISIYMSLTGSSESFGDDDGDGSGDLENRFINIMGM